MSIGGNGMSYRGYAGIAKESTYGEGVAPTYFMDVVSDGFSGDNQHSYDDGTTRSRGRNRGEAGAFVDEGSLDFAINPEGGIGLLLLAAFGSESFTSLQTGAVGEHVFTPADNLDSLSVELGLGDVATARHVGTGVDSISIEHSSEDGLTGSSSMLSKMPKLGITPASPTYSDLRNFWYQDISLDLGGADRSPDVRDVSTELGNSMSQLWRDDRTAGKMELGDRPATATVTLDFETQDLWELFLGAADAQTPQETTAEVAFNAKWESPEMIASTQTPYSLAWDMPRCKIDTQEANLDGKSKIAENVELTALVDPVAGYDVQATLVNGVTNAY